MSDAATRPVNVERIAVKSAIVRLVIADDKAFLASQTVEQEPRQPAVAIPQYADMPGPGNTLPVRRETVDRNQQWDHVCSEALIDLARDRDVIGRIICLDTLPPLGLLDRAIARNDRAVRQHHDE